MTNKELLQNMVEKKGYTLGCYDFALDKLTKSAMKKLLEDFVYDSQDIEIVMRRKKYIVEVFLVDSEFDFSLLTKDEYNDRYGD